jgi:hypothetical protein
LDLYTQEHGDEARAAGRVPASAWDAIGAGAMKMWAGLWVEVFRLLDAKPLKEYGRHEETRTPDLYRVNSEVNNLKPFACLAFPRTTHLKTPQKQHIFGDELVTSFFISLFGNWVAKRQ